MPRYTYKCSDCDVVYDVAHSIRERLRDCEYCGVSDALVRLPSEFISLRKSEGSDNKKKTGSIVKESISDFKQDLKDQKEKLKSWEYEE